MKDTAGGERNCRGDRHHRWSRWKSISLFKIMLPALFGSKLRLNILLLMQKSWPICCLEIQQLFERNLSAVQRQLEKMRAMEVIYRFDAHRKFFYDLNPGYYLFAELQALLERHYKSLPYARQGGYIMSPDGRKRKNLLGWWM